MDKVEAARSPFILLRLAKALTWAFLRGYRPVPGYTVTVREQNGDLYLAVQMTRER
jgi:hypothetical protein